MNYFLYLKTPLLIPNFKILVKGIKRANRHTSNQSIVYIKLKDLKLCKASTASLYKDLVNF